MNLTLLLLVILATPPGFAAQGPCSRKLLTTGNQVQDTSEFTMYLQSLIEEKVITTEQLEPFLQQLEKNRVINPIPPIPGMKFEFAHREFQALIHSGEIDPVLIRQWANSYIKKEKIIETQKIEFQQKTAEVPVYISAAGAMFYKITHPVFGEAYRILKPHGEYQNKADWEEVIWPIKAPKDKSGQYLLMSNFPTGFFDWMKDSANKKLVSKKSKARKFCLELGAHSDLPTMDDYIRLIKHFENNNEEIPYFTNNGLGTFQSLFPDFKFIASWSSTFSPNDDAVGWYFKNGKMEHTSRLDEYHVYCIGVME